MEELFKSAIELYKLLPESLNWLAFVIAPLMLGGLIAYRYTFPGGQPNLLTVGERRRRDRIKFIEECLASAHNSDKNVVAALREERMSLIFQEITGLKLKAPMRQQLVLLHEKSTSRDTWGEINTGFDSLKEQDGKLVKGVDRVNGVFGTFAGLFGILMIVIGCFFFVYIAAAGARVSPQTLKLGFLIAFLYLGAGFVGLRFGLPALRAKQLQKYIPVESSDKEPADEDAETASSRPAIPSPASGNNALPPAPCVTTAREAIDHGKSGDDSCTVKLAAGSTNGTNNHHLRK
ncbi:MAG: hypothetical protein ABW007_15565 [Chitinophagaceae bacterium]